MRESAQSRSSVACDLLCINWGSLIPQMDYSVLSYIRNEQVEISVLRRITIRVISVEVLTEVVGCVFLQLGFEPVKLPLMPVHR